MASMCRRATPLAVVPLVLLLAATVGAPGPVGGLTVPVERKLAATTTIHRSNRWAGWAVKGGPFTSVSASWTEPDLNCAKTPTADEVAWVGLDGAGTSTVEQIGTDATCANGVQSHQDWLEMYPLQTEWFGDLIAPGDAIQAAVTTDGHGDFMLVLTDVTQNFTQVVPEVNTSAQSLSAEAIVEAPTGSAGVLPLADFGTVDFTSVLVDGAPLDSFSNQAEYAMVTPTGALKAQPGTVAGGSFAVTWYHK
jgi:hypothetical protein